MRPFAFTVPILLAATAALATGAGYRAEGSYERKGAYAQSAKIIVMDAPDAFAGSFSTGTKGCGGGVGMLGKATSATEIVFSKRDDGGGFCRITMRFSPDYRTATVSEDGCMFWHGASCDFEGTLKRMGK